MEVNEIIKAAQKIKAQYTETLRTRGLYTQTFEEWLVAAVDAVLPTVSLPQTPEAHHAISVMATRNIKGWNYGK